MISGRSSRRLIVRPSLPRFEPVELERFLEAVDAALSNPVFVILIGGGAAALGYGVRTATKDLDTLTDLSRLERAIEAARKATGLDVPMEPSQWQICPTNSRVD